MYLRKKLWEMLFYFFFFPVSSDDFYVYQVCEVIPCSEIQTMQIVVYISGMKLSVLEHLQMNVF